MVQRAGRRKSRSDLRHGQRKNQTDKTADQPTDADARTTHPGNTLVDGVDAARQNADDGERYRKIRKRIQGARELLRVAHAFEDAGILGGWFNRGRGFDCWSCHHAGVLYKVEIFNEPHSSHEQAGR